MSIHNDETMPALDLPTVPGGSGLRAILTPEEELAACLRDIGRARGESVGWSVRPIDEPCGFELRRVYQARIRIGTWEMHGQVCGTYELALESISWPALRLRELCVNGSEIPFGTRSMEHAACVEDV